MTYSRPVCLALILSAFQVQAGPGLPLLIQVPEMYPTLEAAVINATTGDTISLAAGEHKVPNTVVIDKNDLTILGRTGNPADVNIVRATGGSLQALIHVLEREGFLLEDATLGGTRSLQSCLVVRDSTGARIRNCQFENHLSFGPATGFLESDAVVEDCTFTGCLSVTLGGAASVRTSSDSDRKVVFTGSRFLGNAAGFNGGAIAVSPPPKSAMGDQSPAVFEITDCLFHENLGGGTASFNAGLLGRGHGGAVYIASATTENGSLTARISGCTFELCSASEGGAISLDRSWADYELSVENCLFNDCVATASTGGAIAVYDTGRDDLLMGSESLLEVSGCVFNRNRATVMGGAISVLRTGIPTSYNIRGCEFTENHGRTGGAVALGADDHLVALIGSIDNEAPIVLNGFLQSCEFQLNSATSPNVTGGDGGVLYLFRTATQVEGNTLMANEATGFGGAVYASQDFSLVRNNFIGSPAGLPVGGNTAGRSGGAIHAILSAAPPDSVTQELVGYIPESFCLVNNLITGNTAESGGGGLNLVRHFSYPGGGLVAGNYFLNNFAEFSPGHAIRLSGGFRRDLAIVNNTVVSEATAAKSLKAPLSPNGFLMVLEEDTTCDIMNNLFTVPGSPRGLGVYEIGASTPALHANCFYSLEIPYYDGGNTSLDNATLNDPFNHQGNLTDNPEFREEPDPVFGFFNLHLKATSPLIDTGNDLFFLTPQQQGFFARDIDGVYSPPGSPRVLRAQVDMGADEFAGVDCSLVPGPECDALDLIAVHQDRAGTLNIDTDFTGDGVEDYKDLFGFSVWYYDEP